MRAPVIHRSSRGAALIAVLWLIAVLGLACMATLRIVTFDVDISSAKIHGFRAKVMADKGIAVAANPTVKPSDPLLHYVDGQYGDSYDVTITSEGGRFNINSIIYQEDKALLRSMFTDWGLSMDDAQAVADALSDWVDADDERALNGAEKDWYLAQGRINQPFNRPFYSLDEMRLVKGMDLVEAVRPDWRNWFTVWSAGKLDCNQASAELIAAAAEVPIDIAQQVVDRVRGPDGIKDTDDDVQLNIQQVYDILGVNAEVRPDIVKRLTVNDSTVRIESTGAAEGSKRRITLTLRNRSGNPAILERTEEIIP